MDELNLFNESDLAKVDRFPFIEKFRKAFEDFQRILNKQPSKKNIKKNKLANDSDYIPISILEKQLDEVYGGLWKYRVTQIFQLLNSIVVVLELEVYHPSGVWIMRGCIGAVPIQLKKDENDITPNTINKMAVQMNAPSAKSFALSNAIQSLGEVFGRNINRKEQDLDYIYMTEQMTDFEPKKEQAISLVKSSNIDNMTKNSVLKSIEKASSEKLDSIIEYLTKYQ